MRTPRRSVEDRIPAAAIDGAGGDGGVGVAGEAELAVHVLLVVDADIVDIASLVDEDIEEADEAKFACVRAGAVDECFRFRSRGKESAGLH